MKKIISFILAIVLMACGLQIPAKTVVKADTNVKRYTVLILDTSNKATFESNGKDIYTADTALPDVKKGSSKFLDDISKAEGSNYVAVVGYHQNAYVVSDFTTDYEALKTKIDDLYEEYDVRDISAGLDRANELLESVSNEKIIKNVVLFSTGMTNEGDYNYSGKYNSNTVGSNWYRTYTNVRLYAYANYALKRADVIKKQGINLYSMGLFNTMANMPSEGKAIAEFFELTASDLATSKDYFYPVYDVDELEFTFGEVADDILSQTKKLDFTYSGNSTASCYYSDNYFSKSAYTYNPSLATMSVSFAMSAFGSSDGGKLDYSNKSSNARKLLEDIGVPTNNIQTNEWFMKKPTMDSIGVIIGNKKIKLKDDEYTLIAIAVRGGGYEQEWASNFTIGQSGQHQGFNKAKNDVIVYLKQYIKEQEISGAVKFWITGFSRAAATANLVSGEIDKGISLNTNISYGNEDVYAYCFETPAGALTQNVKYNSKYNNIFNIINQSDPVPYVAPAALGFCRYGVDKYLPSEALNPKEYSRLKNKMLSVYNAMPTTKEYVVDDFQMKKISVENLTWNAYGFLKDGLIVNDTDNNFSQGLFLSNYVTLLSKEFIVNRANYVTHYQNEIREVCSVMFGCTDEQSKKIMDSIMNQAKENWGKLLGSYVWNTGINPWGKEEDALKIISEWLKQAIKDAGITSYNEKTIESAGIKLADLMLALISNHPNYFISAVNNGSGLGAAHYPELCYSWLASMDRNYVGTVQNSLTSGGYRIVRINCEVDVEVYDEDGNIIASIINEKSNNSNGYICGVDDNGQKYVVLPVDETFSVDIKGRTTTQVNYSINEYSALAGEYTRSVNYFNINVDAEEILNGYIPAYDDDENDGGLEGSSIEYSLFNEDGDKIVCDSDLAGQAAKDSYYKVNLTASNNKCGTVIGSGIYQYGQFVKLQALPYEGCSFKGWYQNGELISKYMEYRFCVLNECTIKGEFEKNPLPKTIKLSTTKYNYNGKVKKPSVIILDDQGAKISSSNYTVTYAKGRKNVGKYSVKVTFKNKYTGEKELYFTIIPKNTKIKNVIRKKNSLILKWKKQLKQTSGYNIQVATDRKFKKNKKTITVKKNKTTTAKIKKLKTKKKYYARIRTYKKVAFKGKTIKIYSKWSKVK